MSSKLEEEQRTSDTKSAKIFNRFYVEEGEKVMVKYGVLWLFVLRNVMLCEFILSKYDK